MGDEGREWEEWETVEGKEGWKEELERRGKETRRWGWSVEEELGEKMM